VKRQKRKEQGNSRVSNGSQRPHSNLSFSKMQEDVDTKDHITSSSSPNPTSRRNCKEYIPSIFFVGARVILKKGNLVCDILKPGTGRDGLK
jgi:hypothetical protein